MFIITVNVVNQAFKYSSICSPQRALTQTCRKEQTHRSKIEVLLTSLSCDSGQVEITCILKIAFHMLGCVPLKLLLLLDFSFLPTKVVLGYSQEEIFYLSNVNAIVTHLMFTFYCIILTSIL